MSEIFVKAGLSVPSAIDSLNFLRFLDHLGPWRLSAIDPANGDVETMTFSPFTQVDCVRFICKHNCNRSIYWHRASADNTQHIDLEDEDYDELEYQFMDSDSSMQLTIHSDRNAILEKLPTEVPKCCPPSDSYVFTDDGVQVFWRLTDSIPIKRYLDLAENSKVPISDQRACSEAIASEI